MAVRDAPISSEAIPLATKYCLTVHEASDYFGIGEKKMRKIINEHKNADFLLCNGSKYLIKRKLFEQYLDETYSI